MTRKYVPWIVVAAYACILTGCGGTPLIPVSGKVTEGGSPLEGVAVTFVPNSGDTEIAVGVTDASGAYQLKTKGEDGAMPGDYKVTLAKYEGGETDEAGAGGELADPYDITDEYPDDFDEDAQNEEANKTATNALPPWYADGETSGLTATVAEGGGSIDFAVERKK